MILDPFIVIKLFLCCCYKFERIQVNFFNFRGLTGQGALLIALVTQRILSELPKSDIFKIEEVIAKADECLDKVKDEGPEGNLFF